MKIHKSLCEILLISIIYSLPIIAEGQKLLYYCSRELPSGGWQAYRKNLDNERVDTITKDSRYNYWWVEPSPDHSQIVFMRSPYGSDKDQFDYENAEMVLTDVNGDNSRIILSDNQYNWNAFGNPHWHPEGNKLLIIVQPANATNPFLLVTIDPSGNNPKLLTTQYSLDGNWSPTGDKIVFIGIGNSYSVPLNFEVFTAEYISDSNKVSYIKQLTNDSTRNHDPCFSPDGKTIAFSAGNATLTDADLVTIDHTGLNRKVVLNDKGVHGGPLNWGVDNKIYNHSIYPGKTDFIINAFSVNIGFEETILSSVSHAYISPFFTNKELTGLELSSTYRIEKQLNLSPFSHEITLTGEINQPVEVIIYGLEGERKFTQLFQKNGNQNNTLVLPNGFYFYTLKESGMDTVFGKIFVE